MNRLKGRAFALIGINTVNQPPEKLKAVMAKDQITWRTFCRQGPIFDEWNKPGTPVYYVIDHKGVIRHKWVGYPGMAAMDTAIEKLIDEVEKRQP